MFDTNTQYALNKRTADAIVYVDAFGKRIEVTAEGLDAEEFAIWKELLDEDLHNTEKEDHIYHDHTISFDDQSLAGCTVSDYEAVIIEAEEQLEREILKRQLGTAFLTCLSDSQQERLWLYAIDGINTCQIASMEQVSQKNVYTSIMKARKNILKFLEKGGYKTAIFAAYSEGVIN